MDEQIQPLNYVPIRLIPGGAFPDPVEQEEYHKDCEFLAQYPGATWGLMNSRVMGRMLLMRDVKSVTNRSYKEIRLQYLPPGNGD